MRHRPSRVVALFHGQQVVVAPLRERGNALKRDSESTMRSRNTRSHTHIPRKSVESWRRDASRRLSSDEALDPLTPPSCLSRGRCGVILEKKNSQRTILLKSGTERVHKIRNTRHQTATIDTRELAAPRRATVAGVSRSRDGTYEIVQRDGATQGERAIVIRDRRDAQMKHGVGRALRRGRAFGGRCTNGDGDSRTRATTAATAEIAECDRRSLDSADGRCFAAVVACSFASHFALNARDVWLAYACRIGVIGD